ncbi:MAG: hypothetical protein SQA66_00885 [Candidatus Fervidibacter sacchari]
MKGLTTPTIPSMRLRSGTGDEGRGTREGLMRFWLWKLGRHANRKPRRRKLCDCLSEVASPCGSKATIKSPSKFSVSRCKRCRWVGGAQMRQRVFTRLCSGLTGVAQKTPSLSIRLGGKVREQFSLTGKLLCLRRNQFGLTLLSPSVTTTHSASHQATA